MAGNTEFRLTQLFKFVNARMDFLSTFAITGGQAQLIFPLKDLIEHTVSHCPADWGMDITWNNGSLTVNFRELLLDTMAGDTRYSLPRNS